MTNSATADIVYFPHKSGLIAFQPIAASASQQWTEKSKALWQDHNTCIQLLKLSGVKYKNTLMDALLP